jgi:hypothetical protein
MARFFQARCHANQRGRFLSADPAQAAPILRIPRVEMNMGMRKKSAKEAAKQSGNGEPVHHPWPIVSFEDVERLDNRVAKEGDGPLSALAVDVTSRRPVVFDSFHNYFNEN